MVELRRELGLKEVVATVVTSVIGGGLFLSVVQIQSEVSIGSGIIFAYILAAVPALVIALCYTVLATIYPQSGGEYVFVSRILDPYLGFIASWASWFAQIAVIASLSIGNALLFEQFFTMAGLSTVATFFTNNSQVIAILLVLIFLGINVLGIKSYAKVQMGMFILLMIGIVALIIFGLPNVSLANLSGSLTMDGSMIATASGLLFFGYIGFAVIANVGGEIKNPGKVLPKGIILSMVFVTLLYIIVGVIVYGSITPDFFATYDFSSGSLADVMAHTLPGFIGLYLAFAGVVAVLSSISPGLLQSSRLSLAWAEDNVIPKRLAKLNRFGAPQQSLLITGLGAILIIILVNEFMGAIIMVNMAVLLVYLTVCTSALVLPYKHPNIYCKAKFKFRGFWIAALFGMACSIIFSVGIIRLPNALPGFFLLLIWSTIGTVVYILTLERHKTYWKLQKQQRKEKEKADKELIKKLVDTTKNLIIRKKK